jgi:serine kinase of HPr protein (carbohydrate metabolism regulator)
LALRFIFLPPAAFGASPALVADDQVILERQDGRIMAKCPLPLAGKLEVRGIGIVSVAHLAPEADLKLLIDLDNIEEMPRFPTEVRKEEVLGLPLQCVVLDPFEPSAALKLALALQNSNAISAH